MASFYIIHSKSTDKYYVGSTPDFEMQFEQHRKSHFPKGFKTTATDWKPYFLIHDIPIETANRIVKHIKKNKSTEYFESLKSDASMADKLVEEFNTIRSHPGNNHD